MSPDLSAPVDATDHVRGVGGGSELVLYGDFECPYTAAAIRDIDRLIEHDAAFELVFRHFPLREIHPHAQAAAEAAEAAARQDRFWEMHDILFRNQMRLEPDDLRRFAERLGLDLDRFDSSSPLWPQKLSDRRNLKPAFQSEFKGTPTLFINGGPTGAPLSPAPRAGPGPTTFLTPSAPNMVV